MFLKYIKSLLLVALLPLCFSLHGQTVIFSSDFNSGNEGWSLTDSSILNGRIFMNGNSGGTAVSPFLDLGGHSTVNVSIDWNCLDSSSGFESDDEIYIQFWNGTEWITLWDKNGSEICPNASDDQSGSTGNLNLPVGLESTFIALVAETDSSSEDIYWDNFEVSIPINECDAIASGNLDTDGDGVSDLCDQDDDNDGILDVWEQDCQLGTIGLTSVSGGLSATTVLNGTNPEGSILANHLTLTNYLNPENVATQTISNSHTIEVGFGASDYGIRTSNDGIDFANRIGYGIAFDSAIRDLEFTLLDVDDEDAVIVKAYSLTGEIIPITESMFTIYDPNSITYVGFNEFQASTTEFDGLEGSIQLDFSGYSVTKLEIEYYDPSSGSFTLYGLSGIVCSDLNADGDSLVNRLDLDSDFDGCPDALEGTGGFGQSDISGLTGAILGGVDSSTGIPIAAGPGQEDDSSTDYLITSNQCDDDNDGIINLDDRCDGFDDTVDSDGDSVPDGCDQDKDNDGILDVSEGYDCAPPTDADFMGWYYNDDPPTRDPIVFASSTIANAATAQFDGPGLVSTLAQLPSFGLQIDNTFIDESDLQGAISNNDYIGMSFTTASFPEDTQTFLSGTRIWVEADDYNPVADPNASDLYPYQFSMLVSTDPSFSTNVSSVVINATVNYIGSRDYIEFTGGDVPLLADTTYYLRYYIYNTTSSGGAVIFDDQIPLFGRCSFEDVDSDGVYNHLDLDSDADDCPDAYEGGADLDKTDLVIAGGTLDGGSTTINENLCSDNTCVDLATGIPLFTAPPTGYDNLTGQIIGTSQDIDFNNCFCVQPGSNAVGVQSSLTGISSLATATVSSQWLEAIPNAYLAMESTNKGFVITRVSHVSEVPDLSNDAITNPIEGMLVYDIQDQCVKLFNGTNWKCLERSCNE